MLSQDLELIMTGLSTVSCSQAFAWFQQVYCAQGHWHPSGNPEIFSGVFFSALLPHSPRIQCQGYQVNLPNLELCVYCLFSQLSVPTHVNMNQCAWFQVLLSSAYPIGAAAISWYAKFSVLLRGLSSSGDHFLSWCEHIQAALSFMILLLFKSANLARSSCLIGSVTFLAIVSAPRWSILSQQFSPSCYPTALCTCHSSPLLWTVTIHLFLNEWPLPVDPQRKWKCILKRSEEREMVIHSLHWQEPSLAEAKRARESAVVDGFRSGRAMLWDAW